MSEDARRTPAMPDILMPVAGLDLAPAEPVRQPPAAGAGAPQGLELRHLRYLVALADAGNFTRAAEQVFIAQPTLSQQIRRLEEIVGTPLVQRRRDGLRLNVAGRVLLDASRTVLAQVDQAVSRTRQAAGLGRSRLRVVLPRRLEPVTYDAWTTVVRTVNPRFEFTDPPFRCSLPVTLAFAATGNRPAAVLTGPDTAAGGWAGPVRRSGPADARGMIRVSLQHHPLTASAALVWNGDLPRPLQQMLFDTADILTEPVSSQPAELAS